MPYNPEIDQHAERNKAYGGIIMSMVGAYRKVLITSDNEPSAYVSLDGIVSALETALPYIKKQLVAEMEAEGYKRDVFMTPDEVELVEELVGIVERFEL